LLPKAPVLDAVKGPPEHPGGVLHRLLVPNLGPARLQIRHVGTLVMGRDLERGPGPGLGLLKDQGDVLAHQPRPLVATVLGGLEIRRQPYEEPQLVGGEVELLEKAPVSEVERHDDPFSRSMPQRTPNGTTTPSGRPCHPTTPTSP